MRAAIARHTGEPAREVRCSACGRFAGMAAGVGGVFAVPCRACYRLVLVDKSGNVTAVPLDAESERRTA